MLFLKYFPGGIPVNKVTVILSFFLLVLLAVGGAVIFRKNKKAGVIAGKIVLGILLLYQLNIFSIQIFYDHSELRWIIPWNPSSISYYILPIVALFNIKPFKDTAYVLGLMAGTVMTCSCLLFPDMWLDFYAEKFASAPYYADAVVSGNTEVWASIYMHGCLFVGSVWHIASGYFKIVPKNVKLFLGGFALLLTYAEIGNLFIVPGKNAFFLHESELPFEITHIHYLLDYVILFAVFLWCVYYLVPRLLFKLRYNKLKGDVLPFMPLTEQERKIPYSKYYDRPMPVYKKTAADAMRELPAELACDLGNPESVYDERSIGLRGFAKLPDGGYFVANFTPMPDVTPQMLEWWFKWHPKADLRYKIWFPDEHFSISTNMDESVHYPVEKVGIKTRLAINFLAGDKLGFDCEDMFGKGIVWAVFSRVGILKGKLNHTYMIHFAKQTDNGLVLASRFWVGKDITNDNAIGKFINLKPVKSLFFGKRQAKATGVHCMMEYANLASFLPEIYEEYKDDML